MRILWFVPVSVILLGLGFLARARRRSDASRSLTTEPVSGQWLAEARSREEHPW